MSVDANPYFRTRRWRNQGRRQADLSLGQWQWEGSSLRQSNAATLTTKAVEATLVNRETPLKDTRASPWGKVLKKILCREFLKDMWYSLSTSGDRTVTRCLEKQYLGGHPIQETAGPRDCSCFVNFGQLVQAGYLFCWVTQALVKRTQDCTRPWEG